MESEILLRCEGKAGQLANKVFDSRNEFSKYGVTVKKRLENSIGSDAVVATLFITIIGNVVSDVIALLIKKLFEKKDDYINVNICIKIENSRVTFKLPEDKQKILDYYKNGKE